MPLNLTDVAFVTLRLWEHAGHSDPTSSAAASDDVRTSAAASPNAWHGHGNASTASAASSASWRWNAQSKQQQPEALLGRVPPIQEPQKCKPAGAAESRLGHLRSFHDGRPQRHGQSQVKESGQVQLVSLFLAEHLAPLKKKTKWSNMAFELTLFFLSFFLSILLV